MKNTKNSLRNVLTTSKLFTSTCEERSHPSSTGPQEQHSEILEFSEAGGNERFLEAGEDLFRDINFFKIRDGGKPMIETQK